MALTGFDWYREKPRQRSYEHGKPMNWTNEVSRFGRLYGGIDSDGITERSRDLTSVMAGVAKRLATVTSCPVVMKELYLLPDDERRLLKGVDPSLSPGNAGQLSPSAERAIRNKLVELHHKLLGVEAKADSADVQAALDLFVDVWHREPDRYYRDLWRNSRCPFWTDEYYFDGIADDLWREELDEDGWPKRWDWDRIHVFLREDNEFPDPHGIARTWVVLLAYLLTDPRYLHLH